MNVYVKCSIYLLSFIMLREELDSDSEIMQKKQNLSKGFHIYGRISIQVMFCVEVTKTAHLLTNRSQMNI